MHKKHCEVKYVCVVARMSCCVVQGSETAHLIITVVSSAWCRPLEFKDDITDSGSNDKQLMLVRDIMQHNRNIMFCIFVPQRLFKLCP